MYKRRLKLWKIDGKYLKRPEVKQIARRKVQRDAVGKASHFSINGRAVDMDNVRRYLDKHGFSSLEEFDQAVSPVRYDADVACTTPAQSPMSSVVDRDRLEHQDGSPHHDIDSHEYERSPSVGTSVPKRDVLFVMRDSDAHQILSLSPGARSRQLLSLSPIPRTPTLPMALLLPEIMLSTLSLWLKGSFEAGIWETASDGYLQSNSAPDSICEYNWPNDTTIVTLLLNQKNYVQSRQVLSRICRGLELDIKYKSPTLIAHLIFSVTHLDNFGLREIAAIISNYAHCVSVKRLGSCHPVSQICCMLTMLGNFGREFHARLLQCELDHQEKELGRFHLATIATFNTRCQILEASEALEQSKALMIACESINTDNDETWLLCMESLGRALTKNAQHGEAREVLEHILYTIDARLPHCRWFKSRTLHHISMALEAGHDPLGAEDYARQCVCETTVSHGWRHMQTLQSMANHARILQYLGRLDEVEQINRYIQELLGPPEIEELLS